VGHITCIGLDEGDNIKMDLKKRYGENAQTGFSWLRMELRGRLLCEYHNSGLSA
jgi:hypothetical protein